MAKARGIPGIAAVTMLALLLAQCSLCWAGIYDGGRFGRGSSGAVPVALNHDRRKEKTNIGGKSRGDRNSTQKNDTNKKNRKMKTIKTQKKAKENLWIGNDVVCTGLSHFVAPLYGAPSKTPSGATPKSELKIT